MNKLETVVFRKALRLKDASPVSSVVTELELK